MPKKDDPKMEQIGSPVKYTPNPNLQEVEVGDVPLPPNPNASRREEPEVVEINLPKLPPGAPVLHRSGGQFSLQRLVIENIFTKATRKLSVPLSVNPHDFCARESERLVRLQEVKFWDEHQRDAELKAYKM